jgi:hypothetical protein
MLKFLMKFFGTTLFGLGLMLLLFLLLTPGVLENFENAEVVVNEAIDGFIIENGDEVFDYFVGDLYDDLNLTEYVEFCDTGLVDEQCEIVYALDSSNYSYFFESEMFVEQKQEMVSSVTSELDVVVEPVSAFYAQATWLYIVMGVLLVLGSVLIFFGVGRDWMLFLRKVFMRVGVLFLLSGLVMRYLVFKGPEVLLAWVSMDLPKIILEFSLEIAFSFFESVFLMYWLPFVVVGLVSLVFVLGLWSGMFVRWWKKRKG